MTLPLFIRKFIVDFVETAIGSLLLLNLTLPGNVAAAQQTLVVVGLAVASALVSAVRRTTPEFLRWLSTKLGVSGS